MSNHLLKDPQKRREELTSDNSPYFGGSACLLSLSFVLYYLANKTEDFHSLFPHLEEQVALLYEEDSLLYFYTSAPNLSEEDGAKASKFLDDYYVLFTRLDDLIVFTKERGRTFALSYLEEDRNFLKNILLDNLHAFSNRNDIPNILKEKVASLSFQENLNHE